MAAYIPATSSYQVKTTTSTTTTTSKATTTAASATSSYASSLITSSAKAATTTSSTTSTSKPATTSTTTTTSKPATTSTTTTTTTAKPAATSTTTTTTTTAKPAATSTATTTTAKPATTTTSSSSYVASIVSSSYTAANSTTSTSASSYKPSSTTTTASTSSTSSSSYTPSTSYTGNSYTAPTSSYVASIVSSSYNAANSSTSSYVSSYTPSGTTSTSSYSTGSTSSSSYTPSGSSSYVAALVTNAYNAANNIDSTKSNNVGTSNGNIATQTTPTSSYVSSLITNSYNAANGINSTTASGNSNTAVTTQTNITTSTTTPTNTPTNTPTSTVTSGSTPTSATTTTSTPASTTTTTSTPTTTSTSTTPISSPSQSAAKVIIGSTEVGNAKVNNEVITGNIREIVSGLGGVVTWDGKTNTATATLNGRTIKYDLNTLKDSNGNRFTVSADGHIQVGVLEMAKIAGVEDLIVSKSVDGVMNVSITTGQNIEANTYSASIVNNATNHPVMNKEKKQAIIDLYKLKVIATVNREVTDDVKKQAAYLRSIIGDSSYGFNLTAEQYYKENKLNTLGVVQQNIQKLTAIVDLYKLKVEFLEKGPSDSIANRAIKLRVIIGDSTYGRDQSADEFYKANNLSAWSVKKYQPAPKVIVPDTPTDNSSKILDVIFQTQFYDSTEELTPSGCCGIASAAMVLNALGMKDTDGQTITVEYLHKQRYLEEDDRDKTASSSARWSQYATAFDLDLKNPGNGYSEAEVFAAAKAAIDEGKPVIIQYKTTVDGEQTDMSHFVVIYGYTNGGSSRADFLVMDPQKTSETKGKMTLESSINAWYPVRDNGETAYLDRYIIYSKKQ